MSCECEPCQTSRSLTPPTVYIISHIKSQGSTFCGKAFLMSGGCAGIYRDEYGDSILSVCVNTYSRKNQIMTDANVLVCGHRAEMLLLWFTFVSVAFYALFVSQHTVNILICAALLPMYVRVLICTVHGVLCCIELIVFSLWQGEKGEPSAAGQGSKGEPGTPGMPGLIGHKVWTTPPCQISEHTAVTIHVNHISHLVIFIDFNSWSLFSRVTKVTTEVR